MKSSLPFIAASLLLLTGCSTLDGMGGKVSQSWDTMSETVTAWITPHMAAKEEKKKLPVYDGSCPPVAARPDLTKMVEFTNPESPSDSTKMSEIEIRSVSNTCRIENGGLVMQIDIAMYGETGPKARMKAGDKPSFAYPYFVAVTDEQGTVISKEIFAVSVAYGAKQNDINQTESVFQTMPFPDAASGKNYNVIVGLQLTPEQLAYNQRFAQASITP